MINSIMATAFALKLSRNSDRLPKYSSFHYSKKKDNNFVRYMGIAM